MSEGLTQIYRYRAVAGMGCRKLSKSHIHAGIEESFATFANEFEGFRTDLRRPRHMQ